MLLCQAVVQVDQLILLRLVFAAELTIKHALKLSAYAFPADFGAKCHTHLRAPQQQKAESQQPVCHNT